MVEKGARSFCFLSRSADDSGKHGGFFQELESQGCRITTVSGSVAEMSDTKRAIAAAPTPIVGVVQMSMVLRVGFKLSRSTAFTWLTPFANRTIVFSK